MTAVLEPTTVTRPAADHPAAEVWALVERVQAGDQNAYGEIYRRYADTVFRFVFFRVGSRPLAEDITGDVFVRALKSIGSYTWQGRDLGAWLVTIARNLVADYFKSGRYRLERATEEPAGNAYTIDDSPEGHPDLMVLAHLTNETVRAALLELNPEQREVLTLRLLQDRTVAETARAMGKKEGAIKALQYRAVRALRKLLPEGFEEGRHA